MEGGLFKPYTLRQTAEDSQTIAEVLLRFYLSILPYQMALSVCKQLFLRFR